VKPPKSTKGVVLRRLSAQATKQAFLFLSGAAESIAEVIHAEYAGSRAFPQQFFFPRCNKGAKVHVKNREHIVVSNKKRSKTLNAKNSQSKNKSEERKSKDTQQLVAQWEVRQTQKTTGK
jgi:hypothetical protein